MVTRSIGATCCCVQKICVYPEQCICAFYVILKTKIIDAEHIYGFVGWGETASKVDDVTA